MKKLVGMLLLLGGFLFASINLQTATKEELMAIKGIGEKKALQIMEYRQANKITSPEDLKNIKGFGDSIINNIKEGNDDNKEKVITKIDEKKKELSSKK